MRRTDAESEALRGTLPTEADYECLFEEDAIIFEPNGDVLARLVRNCLSDKTVTEAATLFRTVNGDLSNRGNVICKGAMMNRKRASDGSLGHTKVVPPSLLQLVRDQNARLGLTGPYSDFLGYFDKTGRERFCRETAWSRSHRGIFEISRPLAEEVEYVNKHELRRYWWRSRALYQQRATGTRYSCWLLRSKSSRR